MSQESSPLLVTAVHGTKPECLTGIFRNEVNLAVWKRSLEDECGVFAQRFSEKAGSFEQFISLDADDSAENILPMWALDLPGAQGWIADVSEVVEMFRCLFEPAAVGLRLHVLPGTMCPRFHTDRVPARLLVTYHGRGTEWLPERCVRRAVGGGPLPDQEVSESDIQVLPMGAVSLLKGEGWIGNEGRGLVHRSPASEACSRLLVGLDWLS